MQTDAMHQQLRKFKLITYMLDVLKQERITGNTFKKPGTKKGAT